MEVFYLKINRNVLETYRYLQQWLDIVKEFSQSKIYIVCDNMELQDYVEKNLNFYNLNCEFMKSNRDSEENKYIVENAFTDNWKFTAYALLTPFLHARDMGYKDFWNIDADDLGLYADTDKIFEILNTAKNIALEEKISAFSLDIWDTWSFGITYTDNSIDWFKIFKNHCKDSAFKERFADSFVGINLDLFMNYLSDTSRIKARRFYVENLHFIHHARTSLLSPYMGLRYCKDFKTYLLPLTETLGFGKRSALELPKEHFKIDIGLTLEEGKEKLREFATIYEPLMNSFDTSNNSTDLPISKKYYDQSLKVFYLKMNFVGYMSQAYLKHWFDCLENVSNKKIYIFLDVKNQEQINFFNETFDYVSPEDYEIITNLNDSEKSNFIAENFSNNGYLTPFLHAKNMRYKNFWMIAADRIGLYANSYRISELLDNVEEYAINDGKDQL